MIHLTLQSGHARQSPRSEVSDAVIAELAPLLRSGRHPVPNCAGYTMQVTIDGSALLATLRGAQDAPLVTAGVAPDAAALEALRALHGAKLPATITAPACVDDIHPTAVLDPDAMGWSGDWSRCGAWAWIEHRRDAS